MKIHIEIWIAAQLLSKEKQTFTKKELTNKIIDKFNDRRKGVSTHISSYCVASTRADPGKYRYLTRISPGLYRIYKEGDETHPTKKDAPIHPKLAETPPEFQYLLDDYLDHPFEIRLEHALHDKSIVYNFQKNGIKKIVDAVFSKKRTLLSIATGLGRTIIIAEALKELFNKKIIKYALILTSRNILLDNFANILTEHSIKNYKLTPRISNKIVKNDLEKSILISTVTNYNKYLHEIPNDFFDVIILDECHRLQEKQWDMIERHKSTIIGFTALPSTIMDEKLFSYFNIKKPTVSIGITPIKLKEIATIFRGVNYRSNDLYEQGECNFIRPRDIQDTLILPGNTYVSKSFSIKNKNKILKEGDILLQNIFDFKKLALITSEDLPAIASNNFFIIRATKVDSNFLFSYLQSKTILKEFQKQLDLVATGTTIKHIKIKDLNEIFVPIPLDEEQIGWFTQIKNYDINELTEINKQIIELKDALKKYLVDE